MEVSIDSTDKHVYGSWTCTWSRQPLRFVRYCRKQLEQFHRSQPLSIHPLFPSLLNCKRQWNVWRQQLAQLNYSKHANCIVAKWGLEHDYAHIFPLYFASPSIIISFLSVFFPFLFSHISCTCMAFTVAVTGFRKRLLRPRVPFRYSALLFFIHVHIISIFNKIPSGL